MSARPAARRSALVGSTPVAPASTNQERPPAPEAASATDAAEPTTESTPTTEPAPKAPEAPKPESSPKPARKAAEPRRSAGLTPGNRASNANIPTSLMKKVKARRAKDDLTYGELVIRAIESTGKEKLEKLVSPQEQIGGGIFDPRPQYRSNVTDGPFSPLQFQLRDADFAAIDKLVAECKAGSRTNLIRAALTHFLAD